jgi:hypothetical protein
MDADAKIQLLRELESSLRKKLRDDVAAIKRTKKLIRYGGKTGEAVEELLTGALVEQEESDWVI